MAKKKRKSKLKNIEGVQRRLLAFYTDNLDVCDADDETKPAYVVTEDSYLPVYFNDDENFCVALDYVIVYPFLYVKKARRKKKGEVLTQIYLH